MRYLAINLDKAEGTQYQEDGRWRSGAEGRTERARWLLRSETGSCMQVGCPMRCTFCATGKGGFARNLKAHEIIDQVLTVQERFGTRVSNVGAPQFSLLL